MATGLAQAKINNALDTEITGTVWIQLHVTDPGAAGTSGVASNSTRQSCTFAAAAGGSKATNSVLTWAGVPTTEVYAFYSIWTASTSGTFITSGTISGGSVTAGATFTIASGGLTQTGTGAA